MATGKRKRKASRPEPKGLRSSKNKTRPYQVNCSFTEEQFAQLKADADELGVSVPRLVALRALKLWQ